MLQICLSFRTGPGACLLGLVLALIAAPAAWGQIPEAARDSGKAWHENAWTRMIEQGGVRISYIYYTEADNEHDGVVLRLINDNDVAVRYAFTLIFRAPDADTSTVVRGRLAPGEMKTGDDAGLFWVPFRDGDRSIGEIGLRGLNIWPVRESSSGHTNPTRESRGECFLETFAGMIRGKTLCFPHRKQA